ncbi:MAG TPA: hypothetical protein PK624_01880 [Spirochaetota bacterium]|nr:hypothetical protein [Spirochaetota bacterium]HOR43525.1 hypothetical protein [Spirochaetota bacterium]HPK55685.1 hypothetical protein [Spirochaetota bacterium]
MQQVSGLFQLLSFRKESNQICPVTGLVLKGWRNAWESGIPHKAAPYFSLFAWCYAKHKRCSAPLKSVCPFLLRCPKEMDERKGHRCAGLIGRIPRTGSAGCCGRPVRHDKVR